MLEATPGAPFGLTWKDLLAVEGNMKLRCVFAVLDQENKLLMSCFCSIGGL